MSAAADTLGGPRSGSGALEGCESRRGGQPSGQHDGARHADALVLEVKLRQAFEAQRGERNGGEVGQRGILEHDLGELLGDLPDLPAFPSPRKPTKITGMPR